MSATSEAFPLCQETSLGEMLISSLYSKRVCRRVHESGLWDHVMSDCRCIVLDLQYLLRILASDITLNPCSLSFPDCYSYWYSHLFFDQLKTKCANLYLCLWTSPVQTFKRINEWRKPSKMRNSQLSHHNEGSWPLKVILVAKNKDLTLKSATSNCLQYNSRCFLKISE